MKRTFARIAHRIGRFFELFEHHCTNVHWLQQQGTLGDIEPWPKKHQPDKMAGYTM